MKVIILLSCLIYMSYEDPEDYRAVFERLKLVYYNKDFLGDKPTPSFGIHKINKSGDRLNLGLDVSFQLLRDLEGEDIESSTRFYWYLSNAFKFSGIELRYKNVCKMWDDDAYGIVELMTKYSNIELCHIKKGYKYVKNLWPDTSYFPKSVPQGSYKVEMTSKLLNGTRLVQLNWYGKSNMYVKEMGNIPDF